MYIYICSPSSSSVWFAAGEVHCEPPNNRLDRFRGTLSVDGQTFAVDNEQVLLRGCTIRNTQWCFGLVLYAGAQPRKIIFIIKHNIWYRKIYSILRYSI